MKIKYSLILIAALFNCSISLAQSAASMNDLTLPLALCREISAEYGIKALDLEYCATQSVVTIGWTDLADSATPREVQFQGALREGAVERTCTGYIALTEQGEFAKVLGLRCHL